MKRTFSILLALVLVLVCGMQIAAYVGDIVSPCYEVCPDSYNGHHDFSGRDDDIDYEDFDAFIHKMYVTVRDMCVHCGKFGDKVFDYYHESENHSAGSNGYCVCGRHESTFQHD